MYRELPGISVIPALPLPLSLLLQSFEFIVTINSASSLA
jgi:hypothetical protein